MKNILFILSFCSLGLVSCEDFFSQTVEIDPPPYTKQLSFHLNLNDQDTMVLLLLTRNYGILETVSNQEDYFVGGGSANLYKDGQKWLELSVQDPSSPYVLTGRLPQPLQSGSTYEIRVEHPDYPKVNAAQVMPADFQVDSARVKRNAISGQYGDKYDLVEVFLKDQPGVRNYYEVAISGFYYDVVYNESTGMLDTIGFTERQVYPEDFTDPNVAYGVNGSGLLSDQFFDGQSYKFQAQVYGNTNSPFTVHVRNITEEYYRWSRSYQAKYEAEDNPLVEPVSVFNNLVDGLGIFTVAREKVFVVQ